MEALRPYIFLVLLNVCATLGTYAVGAVPWGGAPAEGLSLIHRYWDGPSYAAVAHSLYDPADPVFEVFGATFGIRVNLPVYPLTVRALAPLFGYLNGLLVATFLFSSLVFCVFYKLVRDFELVSDPLGCAAIFVFFPPRWVIYHTVGASEPPFVLFILGAVYCYRRRWLWACGISAGLAAISRIYGVLLLPAFLLAELYRPSEGAKLKSLTRLSAALVPIPLFLGLHFAFLATRVGSFWAYFEEHSDKMSWIPFGGLFHAGLSRDASESYGTVVLFMAAAYGLLWLWPRHKDLFFVSAVLILPNVFTTLSDQGRFMAPVYPFVLMIAFGDLWSKREAKWAVGLGLPATYAYVWSMVLVNSLPSEAYEPLRAALAAAFP